MTLYQLAPGNARIDEFINTSRRRRELTKEEPRLRKLRNRARQVDKGRIEINLGGFELGLSPEEAIVDLNSALVRSQNRRRQVVDEGQMKEAFPSGDVAPHRGGYEDRAPWIVFATRGRKTPGLGCEAEHE